MKAILLVFLLMPIPLCAQNAQTELSGSWQTDTADGPQTIVVREDSTASFGEETVRWKLEADTIFVLFGDEWLGYNFKLEGDTLTLSGGDLLDPVILRRVGPPSSRRLDPRASGHWV
jgi:hypothetical protein